MPLRPIHLAGRCHEEVLYTRLNRSCSINSASNTIGASEIISAYEDDETTELQPHHQQIGLDCNDDEAEKEEEARIMVNFEAIEVVPNLDEVSLFCALGC